MSEQSVTVRLLLSEMDRAEHRLEVAENETEQCRLEYERAEASEMRAKKYLDEIVAALGDDAPTTKDDAS